MKITPKLYVGLLSLLFSFSGVYAETQQFDQVELEGKFSQGGLLRGKAPVGSLVELNGKPLKVTQQGEFVFGFGRDDDVKQSLTVKSGGHASVTIPLTLSSRDYNVQRIEGVPARTVNPDPKHLTRIRQESSEVKQARDADSDIGGFLQQFIWPINGPITGVYGSQRVYNGEPRRPHFGIDIAAPMGEEIVAPADGIVGLAHPDMFFSGATMVIDHGFGVSTSYLHMSEMRVKKGDKVKQGQVIGLVGASGRATGPHLCWRLNWYQTKLDPQLVVPAMPN